MNYEEKINNLRDDFAIAALTGLLASGYHSGDAAERSYRIANDMLDARIEAIRADRSSAESLKGLTL